MFEHPLPTTIKPVKLARKEGKLVGYMPLKQLTALVADCATDDGRVEADLALHMNGARPEIHGTAKAALQLVCQRCLEPVEVEIDNLLGAGGSQNLDTGSQLVAYDSLITQLINTCTPLIPRREYAPE